MLVHKIRWCYLQQTEFLPIYVVRKFVKSTVVVCDVTLSVYPHRTSLKNMPGHGGNRTYDLWNTSC
jgi:hypothetical protein